VDVESHLMSDHDPLSFTIPSTLIPLHPYPAHTTPVLGRHLHDMYPYTNIKPEYYIDVVIIFTLDNNCFIRCYKCSGRESAISTNQRAYLFLQIPKSTSSCALRHHHRMQQSLFHSGLGLSVCNAVTLADSGGVGGVHGIVAGANRDGDGGGK